MSSDPIDWRALIHWIDNRISPIIGCANRIQEDIEHLSIEEPIKTSIIEDLDIILRNASMILDLKKRFTLGSTEQYINIPDVLEDVLTTQAFEKQGIKLVRRIDRDLPLIRGNTAALQDAFSNILINASEAMEGQAEKLIMISAQVQNTQQGVEITISDNGPGVDQENLNKIFSPFFTTKRKGLGFGLVVSKHLVGTMGGAIRVRNSDEGGAQFTLVFPLANCNDNTSVKEAKILIVDDEPSFRLSLGKDLTRLGYCVDYAADSREAYRKIQTGNYTLAVLDLVMPDMEGILSGIAGIDLLKSVKEDASGTAFIMISGFPDVQAVMNAMRLGAVDFLNKSDLIKPGVGERIKQIIADAFIEQKRKLEATEKLETEITNLWNKLKTAEETGEKGWVLEGLVTNLFRSIAGFEIDEESVNVRSKDEEIDILFRNESQHPYWTKQGSYIAVECKNWHSKKVGKNEYVTFAEKVRNRSGMCRLGFLVSTASFAKTIDTEMVRYSKENILIVPVDGRLLEELVYASDRDLILRKAISNALRH